MSDFRIELKDTHPGGQRVYPNSDWTLSVEHVPTGARVTVPGNVVRSQHAARVLAYEAIGYILGLDPPLLPTPKEP